MATQTATTGQLENAQNVTIAETRYTMEFDHPCYNLIEKFRLKSGEKSKTVPKVGQMSASALTDGVDLVESQAIGMTTIDLTSSEVGLKVILTDKLVRQEDPDVFRMVGRQMGDGMSRKKDEDIVALFTALGGGTSLGGAGKELTLANANGCIARMKNAKAPRPWSVVHHPYAINALMASISVTPGATYPFPRGFAEDLLKDFWSITLDGVGFFNDGEIDIDSSDDGIGAIFSKNAMCIIESQDLNTERERDASLRATEIVVTADYGVFEIDDGYGFPMTYDCAVVTNA